MKPRSRRFFPRTLMLCMAPLLACTTAHATVYNTRESNGSGVWTFPAGTNLLTGTSPSPAGVVTHEGSDATWSTVIDGTLGDTGGGAATSCTPNNGNTVTFPLDLTSTPAGYDITSFDSYCTWGNSGRDNQTYMLQYSTVGNPTTFVTIATVSHGTVVDRSTHDRVTDSSGFLATGVHSIRLVFDRQENGYVGYREFVLQGEPSVVCVDNASRSDNTWPPLVGPNLLAGVTPVDAAPTSQEGSSNNWATVTDGSLGDYTSPASSVTPSNGQTVTYPLDLIAQPAGYDITSFESYCAWGSSGRDDQRYTLEYSVVGDETTFLPLAEVNNHTEWNGGYDSGKKSTRTRVTGNGGPMATGVAAIRLTFHDQENGYTGFREFILRDTPLPTKIVQESNNNGVWTLPVGTNLLAGATAIDPVAPDGSDHGNGDITSSDWSTLMDGSLGVVGTQTDAVAPLNGTSVTYTLDTTVNTNGYNLTSLDTYCTWGDSGRDDQNYTVSYSTVSDPGTFIPIETIDHKTYNPASSTHTRLSSPSGYLASDVAAVKFDFANQENGYTGFREFKLLGSAVPLFSPLTWSGLDGTGGNADWVATVDNNWTDGVGSSPFNTLAPLTFDDSGINTNINIPTALTADSLTFSNATTPYVIGGDDLTVTNGVFLTGSGSAVFDNSLVATSLEVSGTGSLTLSTDNTLTGSVIVNDGTLNLASDYALGDASLTLTGGTANFTSTLPTAGSLTGTGGALVLGDTAGPAATDLWVGDSTSGTFAGTISDASISAIGSLTKVGTGVLTLSGTNTYTGTTTVSDGELQFAQRLSLYNGNTASWTGSNLQVYTTLSLRMGGAGEFTSSDIAALDASGFDSSAVLALDTASGDAEISDDLGFGINIAKKGLNSLTLSGDNTFTQGVTVIQGALNAANPTGVSIPSDLTMGDTHYTSYANMLFDNQFGPDSLITYNTGPSAAIGGKVQLRGTNQTVAGLESPVGNLVAIVQNDETSAPGYMSNPGPCTLTINVADGEFHSFRGIIRNQDGDPVSLVKTGPGTQELINTTAQGYGYNGPTTVEDGTLRLNFAQYNIGFYSDITVEEPATLAFNSDDIIFYFDRVIAGAGDVVVTGANPVVFRNASNSWTGGTTVDGGFLALDAIGEVGAGDGPGQTCVGGAMDPSNVISVINAGTLSLDNAAPLGNSTMLPQYAPSVFIGDNCLMRGGNNNVTFVPNLTLDGAIVEVGVGAGTGGFNTNFAFVGTVVVGGASSYPTDIHTNPDYLPGGATPSANANISLGSVGLPGTTFQVADVTGSSDADLTCSSTLRDVLTYTSPLTKTGPGTMSLDAVNTYTGDTTILEGELTVTSGDAIADTNNVVIDGGKLNLAAAETVNTLFYGGVQQDAGTYGSTGSTATFRDDTRFSGTEILTVTTGPITDPYLLWAEVIPNAADRDKTDDPDGDGFTNIEEFLFGTSPIAADGSLSQIEDTGSGLIVRWNQRADTGTYVLQESATMQENPWPTSTAVITDNAVQDLPGYVRKEAAIPVDGARKFVRVKASE